jgi:hypothetical protein
MLVMVKKTEEMMGKRIEEKCDQIFFSDLILEAGMTIKLPKDDGYTTISISPVFAVHCCIGDVLVLNRDNLNSKWMNIISTGSRHILNYYLESRKITECQLIISGKLLHFGAVVELLAKMKEER